MMRRLGWLIYEKEHSKKNESFIQWFMEEAEVLNIDLRFLLQSQISFGVRENKLEIRLDGLTAATPDFVIMRNVAPLFSEHLERMNIPCFNSYQVASICNDKAKTHQYLAGKGIPMLDTYFITADELSPENLPIPYPFVVKSAAGRGGVEVYLIENEGQLETIRQEFSSLPLVIQPLAGTQGKDLRVYVLGKQVVAAVLRTNENSFKANFSLGGKAGVYTMNEVEQQLVEKIIAQFDFGLVGVDFLFDGEGQLLFNEIEDVVGCRMLCQTTDINIVKLYLEFVLRKLEEGEANDEVL
ncbi:ATP-grasp domain-containing protein [Sutcliffiella horikoshii]|uniref:ATP-grasp domain-containing protein n=1 Tax=Sutcliffiella horikoshii TaxID=79883 RepID=UPI001EEF22A2|nr:ATP-grasp domain-containing protein [Sutcliffiella horikoshii]